MNLLNVQPWFAQLYVTTLSQLTDQTQASEANRAMKVSHDSGHFL